jgi:putative tryptophan/tyrosine transport system substrate-binding protein
MRRIGVLMSAVEGDQKGLESITAFAQGLAELGWTVGRDVRIEYRWGAGDLDCFRRYAAELIALSPDVLLATAGSIVGAFQQASRTVPIVFVTTIDPVGSGFVANLARPGGNATGFVVMEGSFGGKWLELLKEIAPRITRAAVLFDPEVAPYAQYWLNPFKAAAPSFAVEVTLAPVHAASELEAFVAAQARHPNSGLFVLPDPFTN